MVVVADIVVANKYCKTIIEVLTYASVRDSLSIPLVPSSRNHVDLLLLSYPSRSSLPMIGIDNLSNKRYMY